MENQINEIATTSIARYSLIEAGLSDLEKRHSNVVIDVTTPAGIKAAKEGRKEIKEVRLNLEKARIEEKAESVAYGKKVDDEAKRIKARLDPMESAYDNAIKKEEQRLKDIELEKERAFEKAKADEAARIQAEKDAVEAEEKRKFAEAQENFRLEQEAFALKQKELADAQAKIDAERKAAQDKIDQEEQARKDKIIAEEKAALDRIAAAEEASRLKIQKEQDEIARVAKEAADKSETEAKAKRDEELRVENERLAKIEAERLAKQKEEDELKRQEELKAQMSLDGYSLLRSFVENYSNVEEFKDISSQIATFLENAG